MSTEQPHPSSESRTFICTVVFVDVVGYSQQSVAQQVALNPAQKACAAEYLGFLCQPKSLQQTYKGTSVIGRIWNFDEGMSLQLHEVVEQ